MPEPPSTSAARRVDPPQVVIDGGALRQLVNLAQAAVTEHRVTEVKISERCLMDECDRPEHPDCGEWGTKHDPASCGACVPIRVARRALGDAL